MEPSCSSSCSMLGSELRRCESRSSISRILLPVCYFYLHVSKCVREAEETPSHLSLLLWKPRMKTRRWSQRIIPCEHRSTYSLMLIMEQQRSKKYLTPSVTHSSVELNFQITYSTLRWLCAHVLLLLCVFYHRMNHCLFDCFLMIQKVFYRISCHQE